ncbi:MAG TPA: DUF5668 domain-containing protein [Cellulomonas sp.]
MERTGVDRRNVGQAVLGLVLVVGGVTALLDRLGVVDVDWGWVWSHAWPVAIIAVGLITLVSSPRAPVGPLLITGLGVILLISSLGSFDVDVWSLLWPVVVIAIGIAVISGGRRTGSAGAASTDATISAFAFWWGATPRTASQDFRGGSLTAIMGGVEADLRQAWIVGRAGLSVFTFWGGVEVKVPVGWRVEVSGLPLLGGWDDKTVAPVDPDAPVLHVNAVCVMGGLEIKN